MQHEQFENQWKMRGSNSKMLQIQLKWQLPAANGKENGQKSRPNMIQQKKTNTHKKTRRRMARERRGAESSVVSMETLYYKAIY